MNRNIKTHRYVLMVAFLAILASCVHAEEYTVTSPNGQVSASFDVTDGTLFYSVLQEGIEPLPRLAADKRPRFGTRRPAWPTWAWFDSRLAVGGKTRFIDLVRRFASKGHVRSVFIVPLGDRNHLTPE
jgi:hypothetical protein